jgi:F-type H+-transporting ATPase subunit b
MNIPLLFAAAAESGNVVQEISRTFGLNTAHFIAQVISFLIVAGLLYKFAYKKVLNVLEERRQKIAEGLASAEKMKQELANAQAKAHEIMSQANTQANKLIEEARAIAAKVQEQETQKAIAEAQRLIAKAQESNAAELVRLRSDLRREMARLVAETTAKVTGKVLTLDDQKRLAEETTKQIAA